MLVLSNILKVESVLHGHCLQIPFEYRGYSFWIGADYYKSGDSYVVHYKVGMDDSWFATRTDWETDYNKAHADEVLTATDEEIEGVIRKHLENSKEQAAERYLRSAYYFVEVRQMWQENGNKEHAEKFKTFTKYHPVSGVRDSSLVRIKHNATNIIVFCHKNEAGTALELLASYHCLTFVRAKELPMPAGDKQEIGSMVLDAYTSDHETFWDVVRSGECAAEFGGAYLEAERAEPIYGRVDLWNY